MDVLISMGAFSAFFYSLIGSLFIDPHNYLFYETSATIITLVLLGNLFEKRAVKRTQSNLKELQDYQIEESYCLINGEWKYLPTSEVNVGTKIQVNTGDKVPLDAKVLEGTASIDESLISGESKPVRKKEGDKVISGSVVQEGHLICKVLKPADQSTLAQIINLVKEAEEQKPSIQKLGDQVSNVFVPVVILLSILAIPLNYYLLDQDITNSLMRSVAILVIACPCAMGLATPTAIMVGLGKAAKKGVLVKSAAALERMAKARVIVFDKTGTLTTAKFHIQEEWYQEEKESCFGIIKAMEQKSSHPFAKFLREHIKEDAAELESIKEVEGKGLIALDANKNEYKLGSRSYAAPDAKAGYNIYLSKNGNPIAGLKVTDQAKDGLKACFDYLKQEEIEHVILTGDQKAAADDFASTHKLNVESELLPDQKLDRLKALRKKGILMMVGDGINDAPALSIADVGVSFASATDLAQQQAEVILLDKTSLEQFVYAHQLCKKTYTTIKQNLFWALAYNVVAIPMAGLGFLSPMLAAGSMAFSDLIVIGNSLRLRYKV